MSLRRAGILVALAWCGCAAAETWLEKDLAACRAQADDARRLACYDALTPRPAVLPAATQPATAAQPAPVVAAPAPVRLVGSFAGWRRHLVLELDNGQAWRYIGMDETFRDQPLASPQITIEKSFSGATWMTVAGEPREGKVTRVR
ncbi:MAG TPA: hypothetical protein VM074_02415 [Solimonas sp.]|nr:hypothetical protein [Solimonas sp.]